MAQGDEDERARGDRALPPPPPDDSPEARRLQAEVRSRLFGSPPPRVMIGPYEVVRRLGHGGMGTVHLARRDDRLFAVKTLVAPGETAVARLRREARALQTLDHPHVVRIEETGAWTHGLYVAMEYVEGPTLRDHLRAGVPWFEVVALLAGVGEALAAAHERGILHRDVKPDNVVIDHAGVPKLVDFGLAKALPGTSAEKHATLADPLTRTGASLGTIGYASPEQLLGRPLDPRADQFSLCATLYELLWGRLPFSGLTTDAIGLATIAGRIDPPPEDTTVPPPIIAALLQGLSPTPEARHSDIPTLLEHLRPALDP